MLSLSSKRRPLRESPFLEPLAKHSLPRRSHDTVAPPRTQTLRLPRETRRKWMNDALETLDVTTLSLALQTALGDTPWHQRSVDTAMIESPTLVTDDARARELLTDPTTPSPSSVPSLKTPPNVTLSSVALPLYSRGRGNRSPTKPPHRLPRVTSPSFSKEMLATLQAHLEDKIRGNLWQNEVRSRLARPLSASVFSNRHEQLCHALVAPQFATGLLYPYSLEAHDASSRFSRMRRKHVYRRELLANLRRFAVAIRYFRRVVMPWLVRAHRRRRRAAIKIQRRLRRRLAWKRNVVRPLATRCVAQVFRTACARTGARRYLLSALGRLVRARQARIQFARERQRVLVRWVAKTRVALFVHRVWCAGWLRDKRAQNLERLRTEVAELEATDAAVRLEYSTIFATAFGRKLLKKELFAWRQTIKKPATRSLTVEADDTLVRLRQCFGIFDMDGSGALDLDEFELMLAHLRATIAKVDDRKRAKLSTAQVRDLFSSLDGDGDGTVTCDELETWWRARQRDDAAMSSASVSLLAVGVDRLVLTGHGMLFWLLGKKQTLERKFVKKRLVKSAQTSAKRALLESWQQDETATWRCPHCARRFGLGRDLRDHVTHQCTCHGGEYVVDPFVWRTWVREEELRLLKEDHDDEQDDSRNSDSVSSSVASVGGA